MAFRGAPSLVNRISAVASDAPGAVTRHSAANAATCDPERGTTVTADGSTNFKDIHSGAQFWPLIVENGEWWRMLTYAFTHGGILHLVFNMVVLYQIGPLLEVEIGRSRFLILYTLTAMTATLADLLWHPNIPVVGASGALFGLIGFAIAWYHRLGGFQALELRNFMLKWAAFSFVFGLMVGADNAAHLGGALGGAAIGFILPLNSWTRRKTDKLCTVLAWGCALLIVAAFAGLALSWLRPPSTS